MTNPKTKPQLPEFDTAIETANGMVASNPSNRKAIQKFRETMGKREWCNKGCRYYDRCPFQPVSCDPQNLVRVRKSDNESLYPCLLKTQPVELQRSFINLFMEGRYGLAHELCMTAFHYKHSIGSDPTKTDVKSYFELLLKLNKSIYGEAKNIEAPDDMEVKITEVGRAPAIDEILEARSDPNALTPRNKAEYTLDYNKEDEDSLLSGHTMEDYVKGRPIGDQDGE